ncbi:TetR/AcrR family transcriptional regulator [Tardiphaga sp. 20_F10_N6_6]|jgi:TetR/AcrR family transcriptional regulator|uniref:TetR/AcrR family transcriptional regulator n=1 Tax=Tardiphaga robiniae TaxID=943830 RepID=A0A7G6U0Y7_9BRAD|nr:TetR/AcrR family transcriptional regulator [Tardiphaga robiniae]QND72669.1 TetR/AcrR family transcriptional regulator [Tardiphaga robiniae]
MARPRANNYDDKRRAILDRSAELFSEYGYDRASMNKIAAACGVSKANLYHYYKDKDELLFDVIRVHLEDLLQVVEAADHPDLAPAARLRDLVAALLEAYRDADAQHSVQISSMRFLSDERQSTLKNMERELVRIFSSAVSAIAPQLAGTTMLKPVTMSLFGMVNWHYLWFRSQGPFTRADYADLVTRLIVDGTRDLLAQPAPVPKRAAARRK